MATMNVAVAPPLLRRLSSALVLATIRDTGPVSRGGIARLAIQSVEERLFSFEAVREP
jgi:hypothetical protein